MAVYILAAKCVHFQSTRSSEWTMNSGDLHFSTLVSIVCWNVSSPPSWSLCILSCILNKTDLLVTPIKLKHTSTLYTMICSWLPDAVKVEPAGLSPDPGRVDLSERPWIFHLTQLQDVMKRPVSSKFFHLSPDLV